MANRHTHKKLRAEIRARMAATGESHQVALQAIRSRRRCEESVVVAPMPRAPDLISTRYFGLPVTLAVYDVLSQARLILVSGSAGLVGLPFSKPLPVLAGAGVVQ